MIEKSKTPAPTPAPPSTPPSMPVTQPQDPTSSQDESPKAQHPKPSLSPSHSDQAQPVVIEYKGKTVILGTTWKEISAAIDSRIQDRRLAVGMKVCLVKKLGSRVTAEEEDEVMKAYRAVVYGDG